jgi:hypothetical protein
VDGATLATAIQVCATGFFFFLVLGGARYLFKSNPFGYQ